MMKTTRPDSASSMASTFSSFSTLPSLTRNKHSISSFEQVSFLNPPTVTAPTWAVHDANSGELLWGKEVGLRKEIASLTKIMTFMVAHNLLTQLQQNLDTLEFRVHSKSASIGGTHSGLREGETVKVKDLFYGLMLPSGNDCGLALAAGIGGLILSQKKSKLIPKDYDSAVYIFVKEMNKFAAKTGLKNTFFANPHGLACGNKSTTSDLGKLAYHALQIPLIAEVSSTIEYQTTVITAKGVERQLNWRNTNKLLEKGYCGLKTGTTDIAGPCLSSVLRKGKVGVIVTVLNCKTFDHRWVDSEKLANWSMNNLLDIEEKLCGMNYNDQMKRNKRRYVASLCQKL